MIERDAAERTAPQTDALAPARTYCRTDKHDAMEMKFRADTCFPKFATERTDNALPMCKKSTTDAFKQDPTAVRPTTETELPRRP
jgi:hypothetical protein